MSAKRVPFNHAASHGSGGADRISGLYLGAWNAGVAYKVGDVVSKAGVIYRCILAHTNQAPPNATYWTAETTGGSYTDEQAQDAVGDILADDTTLDFTYDDATPSITAVVKGVRESGGAKLAMGAVSDGQYLRRVGSTVVGTWLALGIVTQGNMLEVEGASSPVTPIAVTAGTVA